MDVTGSGAKLIHAFKHIPGPVCLPIIGNLHLYKLGIYNVNKYHKVLQHLFETYGPIVKEKIGPSSVIHLFDPDDAKTVYKNEGKMPYVAPLMETAQLYRKKADMALGLGNTNGEEWYRLRAAVRHLMLKPRDVQQFLPAVHLVAKDLVKRLYVCRDKDHVIPNLATEIGKWSQESAGVVCFDKRLGYLDDGPQQNVITEVIQANQTVFRLSGHLKFSYPVYKYVATPKWKRIVNAEDIVVKTAMKYIDEAMGSIEQLAQNDQLMSNRFGFLLSLMAKEELSRKDIYIITLSLFIDGLSTTVPTVLFNLYALATNPKVQQKAFEEVMAVVGTADTLTSGHLSQLNFIKAIVKETFRMYPNGTEISRILQDNLVLSGYQVPQQTNVSINMGVHFRSRKYFSFPDEFRPERWLRSEASGNIHPYLLTPFGLGTRTCAGRRFAEQDMYTILVEIIRHFQLSFRGSQPMEQVYNTLLMPEHPLQICFEPRNL